MTSKHAQGYSSQVRIFSALLEPETVISIYQEFQTLHLILQVKSAAMNFLLSKMLHFLGSMDVYSLMSNFMCTFIFHL